jgi:hypothetical protein
VDVVASASRRLALSVRLANASRFKHEFLHRLMDRFVKLSSRRLFSREEDSSDSSVDPGEIGCEEESSSTGATVRFRRRNRAVGIMMLILLEVEAPHCMSTCDRTECGGDALEEENESRRPLPAIKSDSSLSLSPTMICGLSPLCSSIDGSDSSGDIQSRL